MEQSQWLKDKVCVVTGGAGTLCSCFCRELARQGAKVAVLDLNQEHAVERASEICEAGGISVGIGADVLSVSSMEAARNAVNAELGTCDILINGAGGNHPGGTTSGEYYLPECSEKEGAITFFDLNAEDLKFVFDINCVGTIIPTQVFAKEMARKESVSIINISSMSAFAPLTKVPAYSAAKAAISNLTQWMAVYFSKTGIRVNAIAPGFFVASQNRDLLFNKDGTFTARSQKIIAKTPAGRFGEIDELLGALLFLVNDKAASFVNGVILPVDGGFYAYSGV